MTHQRLFHSLSPVLSCLYSQPSICMVELGPLLGLGMAALGILRALKFALLGGDVGVVAAGEKAFPWALPDDLGEVVTFAVTSAFADMV